MNRPFLASGRRAHGFTLLEMLVVLVLAAIAVSVVGIGGQAYMDRSRYTQAVRDVASQLSNARALSVQEGRPVTVAYFPDTHRLVVDGRLSVEVPASLIVQWEAIRRNPRAARKGDSDAAGEPIFVFNADGGARGGRLAVLRGERGVAFRVNWLLGTVEQSMAAGQS